MSAPPDTRKLLRWLERAARHRGSALVVPFALLPAACSLPPAGSGGNCCTESEWTGTAEVAAAYASEGAVERLGCPSKLERGYDPPKTPLPPDAGLPPQDVLDLLDEPTRKRRESGDVSSCVYRWLACCPGGRPLDVDGRLVVAQEVVGAGWSKGAMGRLGRSLTPETRAAVARGWLEDALAEHASVASFARATLELMALGAPPRLLAAHQRAGMQEIGHAERCFALSRAYGGLAVDPGPIQVPAPRATGLARLARDTFVEGCVAETIGALLAMRALAGCRVEATRAALRVIAAEESAHAALAWETVEWAVSKGGRLVAGAVVAAAAELRQQVTERLTDPPTEATSAVYAHGRLGTEDRLCAVHDAWQGIIEPLLRQTLARCGTSM